MESSTPQARSGDAIQAPSAPAEEEQLEAQAVEPAGISLSKSASRPTVSAVGQVVTYRFTARNTGTVALTSVTVTDELEGLGGITCNRAAPVTLEPAQAVTCAANLTVTQAMLDFGDLYNSANVVGTYSIEGQTDYVGANAAAHVAVDQRPAIALTASVSPTGRADRGDRRSYAATATNTGNVTLTGARITSSLKALDLDCDPSARATLAPGDTIDCAGSYTVSRGDARRGRVSNLLTARADGPYGDDVTDSTRLRTAVTKPPAADTDTDTGLADTGGPVGSLAVGLAGILALVSGTVLIRRGRRS